MALIIQAAGRLRYSGSTLRVVEADSNTAADRLWIEESLPFNIAFRSAKVAQRKSKARYFRRAKGDTRKFTA